MAGAFEQASYAGRVTVRAGHANGLPSRHAHVLRLPWDGMREARMWDSQSRKSEPQVRFVTVEQSADSAVTRTGSLLHPGASIVAGASRGET
jgi:hypothetical protein